MLLRLIPGEVRWVLSMLPGKTKREATRIATPATHLPQLPPALCDAPPAADDELLVRWRKIESPFLHLPPPDLQLTGWRDPFIFATNTSAAPSEWEWKGEWLLVVGGRAAGVVGVLG